MDKILAEQIQQNFAEYKKDMIWILIGFAIIVLIIQFIYNFKLSQKIETFKGVLKRNEIKFSKHSEMQIECLKNMYNHLVDLHFSFNNIFTPEYLTHESLKNNIGNLFVIFNSNMNYFDRNKILLTDDIITQINVIHQKFKKIKFTLKSELQNLADLEEANESENPQTIYGDPDSETSSISLRIKNLKKNSEISTFENDIKEIRKLVEKYFKALTQ